MPQKITGEVTSSQFEERVAAHNRGIRARIDARISQSSARASPQKSTLTGAPESLLSPPKPISLSSESLETSSGTVLGTMDNTNSSFASQHKKTKASLPEPLETPTGAQFVNLANTPVNKNYRSQQYVTPKDAETAKSAAQNSPRVLPSWLPTGGKLSSASAPSAMVAASLVAGTTVGMVSDQPTPLLVAALAAAEGIRYCTQGFAAQQALDQSKVLHDVETKQAQELHREALQQSQIELERAQVHHDAEMKQNREHHNQELQREAEQHLQDLTTQLRESQKESDRDLWEQQNNNKQSTMTVSALFLAGAFSMAVEGTLPPETGNLWMAPAFPLVDVYYICLALCVSFLVLSILGAMCSIKRMATYMLSRTATQQDTLRDLRKEAYEQLKRLEEVEEETLRPQNLGRSTSVDDPFRLNERVRVHMGWYMGAAHYSIGQVVAVRNEKQAPFSANISGDVWGLVYDIKFDERSVEVGVEKGRIDRSLPNRKTVQESLKSSRKEFSKRLWENPVMVLEWNPVGHGRFVGSFDEWYHFDVVSNISIFSELSFKLGALSLVLALGVYTEAHLRMGEADEEETSESAAFFFWVVLFFGVSACVVLEFSSKLYPMPHWRDNHKQPTVGAEDHSHRRTIDYSSRVVVENLNGSLSRYNGREGVCLRPSRVVDSWKVLLQKEVTARGVLPEEEVRIPLENLLKLSHLSPKRSRVRLEMVNVTDIEAKQKELFKLIDINKDNHLDLREIGLVIGFEPPDIPDLRAPFLRDEVGNDHDVGGGDEVPSPLSVHGGLKAAQDPLNDPRLLDNSSKVHALLKENPIMQEAILLLLEQLFCDDEAFVRLKLKNEAEAHGCLAVLRTRARKAFARINKGVSWPITAESLVASTRNGFFYFPGSSPSSRRKITEMNYQGWQKINYQGWQKIMSTIFQKKFF